jgi:NAD(P)-dependent dehydrogenase (short-subunit alcohol dehydrogenase family)
MHVVADVTHGEDLCRVADAAEARFGRIDVWVNDAGVSIYGKTADVPVDAARRLFDTNYWGLVQGSLVAVGRMRARGGALVNVGSIVSHRAIPLQGHYSASKHAVRGFTDTLRMELAHDGAPVTVSLVMPSAIATPYPQHAESYLPEGQQPELPTPRYDPALVAEAILDCAVHGTRERLVGGDGLMTRAFAHWAPSLTDKYMQKVLWGQSMKPADGRQRPILRRPRPGSAAVHGDYDLRTVRRTAVTQRSAKVAFGGIVLAVLTGITAFVALGRTGSGFGRRRHSAA